MSAGLLVLVALLLLAVVGLLAYAGCEPFDAADPVAPPVKEVPPVVRPSYADVVRATPGLVAHWTLADPAGSLILRDVGPNTLNGRYVDGPPDVQRSKPDGALATRDPQDRCAGFPGEAGYAVIDFSPLLNPGPNLRFSFEVWARLRDPAGRVGTSEHLAASRLASPSDDNFGWDLFVTYGPGGVPTFTARVFSGDGADETRAAALVQSTTTSPDGAWHHVVLTYDGAGEGTLAIAVRLGGEAELFPRSTTPARYAPNPSVGLHLGAGLFGLPYNHFEGDLDEAAFYNLVLTREQIEAHHRAAQP